jgi:hypothetical protein
MSMRVGSPEHRNLFCRTFIETHVAYEPESLPWPPLEKRYVDLLRALPFWSFALSMEQEAGRMITAFARSIDDPAIREAVELQAYEEARHGRLLQTLLKRYEIDVPVLPLSTTPVRRDDFLVFGFSECLDSIVGFGGFALARQKQIFPKELLDIFEQTLYEEARHIVFFINWWRYEEAVAGHANPFARLVRALEFHVRAVMHSAQGAQGTIDLTGGGSRAILSGVTPAMFLEAALQENRTMMRRLDRRLLRPRIIPALATAALLGLRMLPPRPATKTRPRAAAA